MASDISYIIYIGMYLRISNIKICIVMQICILTYFDLCLIILLQGTSKEILYFDVTI